MGETKPPLGSNSDGVLGRFLAAVQSEFNQKPISTIHYVLIILTIVGGLLWALVIWVLPRWQVLFGFGYLAVLGVILALATYTFLRGLRVPRPWPLQHATGHYLRTLTISGWCAFAVMVSGPHLATQFSQLSNINQSIAELKSNEPQTQSVTGEISGLEERALAAFVQVMLASGLGFWASGLFFVSFMSLLKQLAAGLIIVDMILAECESRVPPTSVDSDAND